MAKTYKQAIRKPKGGAVAGDNDYVQASAAQSLAQYYKMNPETIYDWASKYNVKLIEKGAVITDPKNKDKFLIDVLNNEFVKMKVKLLGKVSAKKKKSELVEEKKEEQIDIVNLARKKISHIKLADTKENEAKINALKKISGTKWVGNTIHPNIDFCLTAINLESNNSGAYNPIPTRISGLKGIYVINEDGSLFCEARIIKEAEKQYKIEYLTMPGWNEFEEYYSNFIEKVEKKSDKKHGKEKGFMKEKPYELLDVNGVRIKPGYTVKTQQPVGGLMSPAESEIGVIEETMDAFGNKAFQIKFRKPGKKYDQFILLTGKVNEVTGKPLDEMLVSIKRKDVENAKESLFKKAFAANRPKGAPKPEALIDTFKKQKQARKRKAEKQKLEENKAMFASMDSAGTLYPKSKTGKRIDPEELKASLKAKKATRKKKSK